MIFKVITLFLQVYIKERTGILTDLVLFYMSLDGLSLFDNSS